MDSPPGRELLDWARNLSEAWRRGKANWSIAGNPVECGEILQARFEGSVSPIGRFFVELILALVLSETKGVSFGAI
jgi:hypothetical protein